MTHPLSYFTLGSAAALISYFSGSTALGTVTAYGFSLIYLAIFGNGVSIGSGIEFMTIWTASYTYFSICLVFAFVGAMGSLALWQFQFLDGAETYLSQHSKNSAKLKPSSLSIFFFWLWFLLWQLGTLVLFEIEAPGYTFAIAGFLTVGLQLLGWFVLFLVLRNEPAFFSKDAKDGAWTVVWTNAAFYLIFGLVYVICQLTVSSTVWFSDMWNFYASLIVAAFGFVWYLIIYAWLAKDQERPKPPLTGLISLKYVQL